MKKQFETGQTMGGSKQRKILNIPIHYFRKKIFSMKTIPLVATRTTFEDNLLF